jgi:hypothetical protein
VVGWDMPFERELIEQSDLFDLPMPHHDLQSCQLVECVLIKPAAGS